MYAVTPEFLAAILADVRQVVARVAIDYTDPMQDQSMTATASEVARVSWPAQTADAVALVPYYWASLDGTWLAGAGRHPMPDTAQLARLYQVGWWGSQLAGAGGAFAAPLPTLTVAHSARIVRSLRVTGDSARGEYPVNFAIRLYSAADVLLHTQTVTGNAAVEWSLALDPAVQGVAKQVLEVSKWSHTGRQAKITEFFTTIQETYEADDLASLRFLEESRPSIGEVSANELAVSLSNADHRFDVDNDASPLYGLVLPNRRLRVWLGLPLGETVEWVPLGTFWSVSWDTPDDNLEAVVLARDRLEVLRQRTYTFGTVMTNISLLDLATSVLGDAGLNASEFSIDPALDAITLPYVWMAPTSHRELIRMIAEAAAVPVYVTRDGKLIIGAVAAAGAQSITRNDYYPPLGTPSAQDGVANEIIVGAQTPVLSAVHEVYRSGALLIPNRLTDPPSNVVTVSVQYGSVPVIAAAASLTPVQSGVSITAATYRVDGADVTITNSNTTDKTTTLVINGRVLATQSGGQATAQDAVSIQANGVMSKQVSGNPLIQTVAQAQDVADAMLAEQATPTRGIELAWRGNPALEVGDEVTVTTDSHGRTSTYRVVRQELEWAGALSARLTGRRVVG